MSIFLEQHCNTFGYYLYFEGGVESNFGSGNQNTDVENHALHWRKISLVKTLLAETLFFMNAVCIMQIN